MSGFNYDENILKSSSLGSNLLRTSMPNSNFLTFSESFYIRRFKNKGYRYYLGRKRKQIPSIIARESIEDRGDS